MGRQTLELHRTRSYDYGLYNLHALMTLAIMGEQVGVDLWGYNTDPGSKRNIRESIRYMAGFGTSDMVWPFEQIAEKSISLAYEDGDHFSRYYPYDLYSALRIGYNLRGPLLSCCNGKIAK
nr:alginate lyase family protein [Dyadobacter sp. CY323]